MYCFLFATLLSLYLCLTSHCLNFVLFFLSSSFYICTLICLQKLHVHTRLIVMSEWFCCRRVSVPRSDTISWTPVPMTLICGWLSWQRRSRERECRADRGEEQSRGVRVEEGRYAQLPAAKGSITVFRENPTSSLIISLLNHCGKECQRCVYVILNSALMHISI